MQGTYLKFYAHEYLTHQHTPVYSWLLEQAGNIGIQGGWVFKAIAGFGRHGIFPKDQLLELANDLPVEVVFMVSDDEAERLLETIRSEGMTLFYVRMPTEFGVINGERFISQQRDEL